MEIKPKIPLKWQLLEETTKDCLLLLKSVVSKKWVETR